MANCLTCAGRDLSDAWRDFMITLGEELRLYWLLDKLTLWLLRLGFA